MDAIFSIDGGAGVGASRCVSKDRNISVSSVLLWSTTLDTSFCRKLRAVMGGASSHISRNLCDTAFF